MREEQKDGLRIIVEDLKTGEKQQVTIPMGEYFFVTASPCYVDGIQSYKTGTHVVTIKGRIANQGAM